MMIACRIFSGRMKNGQYADRFKSLSSQYGAKNIVYVIDELALKAHSRHSDAFQNIDTLMATAEERSPRSPQKDNRGQQNTRVLDDAFIQRQGYDLLEFLSKFIKPVMLMMPLGQTLIIGEDDDNRDWKILAKDYRVWVNVQDGARTIATPCTGQLIRDLSSTGDELDFDIEE